MKNKKKNSRPTLTPEDRKLLKFVRASMRDDRARQLGSNVWETDYDAAEELLSKLIDHD